MDVITKNISDYKDQTSVESIRETGKAYLFGNQEDAETKSKGLQLIIEAHKQKDAEATFIVAKLLLDGVLKASGKNTTDYALSLMCSAANNGCIQARAYLNAFCDERYSDEYDTIDNKHTVGALVDFDGKPIRINRQGIFTPIDAVLEYENNQNILTLKTNLLFLNDESMDNPEKFEQAVIQGIREWEGEYEVFGGQHLRVHIELTNDANLFDNLLIMPVTEEIGSTMKAVSNVLGTKERKAQISDLLENKRSFVTSGMKWSATSRKIICVQSADGKFDDYEEIKHVSKHEFGHALGLGDLYYSPTDSLAGVEIGTYGELDSYAITDKYYNLVMCDHHGPISNNDIEMVILAFRENKMQMYQPSKIKGKVSAALGKGN